MIIVKVINKYITKIKITMIIIDAKSDGIERALKKLKKKFEQTKVLKQLRSRKEYTKPSIKRRDELKKAIYLNKKFGTNE